MSTDLGYAKYISVTTFRRNGDPVSTPVWTVPVGEKIYVSTGTLTGKVKRVRGNGRATVALCDMAGKNVGPSHEASARLLPYADKPEVHELMLRKYGVQQRLVELLDKARNHTKWPVGERVLIELTLQD